jgi:hypothetical protein
VTPPTGATGTFKMIGVTTGPAGDAWPAIDLAKVAFAQTGPRKLTTFALNISGDALAAIKPTGIFTARVPYAKAAALPSGCPTSAPSSPPAASLAAPHWPSSATLSQPPRPSEPPSHQVDRGE